MVHISSWFWSLPNLCPNGYGPYLMAVQKKQQKILSSGKNPEKTNKKRKRKLTTCGNEYGDGSGDNRNGKKLLKEMN